MNTNNNHQQLIDLLSKREQLMSSSKPPHPRHAAKLLGISDELYHYLSHMSDKMRSHNRFNQDFSSIKVG